MLCRYDFFGLDIIRKKNIFLPKRSTNFFLFELYNTNKLRKKLMELTIHIRQKPSQTICPALQVRDPKISSKQSKTNRLRCFLSKFKKN